MKAPMRFTALFAGLAIAAPVAAQSTLGFRAGVSLGTLAGDGVEDPDSRTGLSIGGYYSLGLSPNLGLQIGGAYVQKGASQTVDVEGEPVDVTFALDYFEVPILLRLGVPTAGSLSPHFFAGPAISFEGTCEAEGEVGGFSATIGCDDLGVLDTKAIDFGAVAGAGLGIATPGVLTITLDVLYNLGLQSVIDVEVDTDAKNRAWSFLAGAAFPIR